MTSYERVKVVADFTQNVKFARKGDANAFSKLYEAVYRELYYIALCNLNNPHDAEDAVSDCVTDAFASIKKLRDEDAFKAWIIKILWAKIKRKQREYANSAAEISDDIAFYENEFAYVDIKESLSVLDDEEKFIFSLSLIGGYNSHEIAELIHINPSTVRSKLSRSRLKLQKSFTKG